MRMHGFLTSAAMLAALSFPGAAGATNLVHNPFFSTPRAGLPPPPTTDVTATDPAVLGGYAAADEWLIWTGVPGGRVWTRLEPSELFLGARMLHVRGYEVDQVFAPVHTGPKYGYFCALVKVVSGQVGAGAGDQGNSGPGETVGPGSWVRIGGHQQSTPVNQVAIFGIGDNPEFYIQYVELSPEPIDCERRVDITKLGLPPGYRKPDPYPWEMHPEQGGAVQPAGNPAQGAAGNPNGYFENMSPRGVAHDDSGAGGGHEPTHPVPGKAPASGQLPVQGNTIQQQHPAQPATQK
jgi:hypothetical protein